MSRMEQLLLFANTEPPALSRDVPLSEGRGCNLRHRLGPPSLP